LVCLSPHSVGLGVFDTRRWTLNADAEPDREIKGLFAAEAKLTG
jgi:hypothetical protein